MADTSDHKSKHKHAAPTVQNLRCRQRNTQIEIRKNKRDRKFNSKRVRIEDAEKEGGLISLEQTLEACQQLVQSGTSGVGDCLPLLRRAFTQGPEYIDVLFQLDNGLQSLVGVLTGSNVDLQEQAAWCLTNMAAGRANHALAIARAAAPYFITYVAGSSPALQDQCAWALGNIAGDGVECRKMLHAQGCLPPLVKLLESSTPACARSAAFALSNLVRDLPDIANDAAKYGLLDILLGFLQKADTPSELLSEMAWVLTYLTNSPELTEQLVTNGFLPVIVEIIVHTAMTGQVQQDSGKECDQMVTPFLRALGNVCAGPGEHSLAACENPRLMPALLRLLQSDQPWVAKEAVWVVSNMTGDYNVSQSIAYGPVLTALLAQLDKTYDVQVETMYTLCNMASHGETVCSELVAHGAVAKVVPLLRHLDMELLHMALAFCEAALRYADARFVFEECGGVTSLEQLENHPNASIQSQALEIMETYFDQEEEEDLD